MPKVLIAYFTQSGSTKIIADQIVLGLEKNGLEASFYDICNDPLPDINEFDLIGIGTPVYIFRPPFNVLDFIHKLPNLNGIPFFVFLLYGALPGTAGNIVRKKMERKGGREVGYQKFKGADYFVGYVQRGTLFSPYNPNEQDFISAKQFGESINTHMSGDQYVKPPRDPFPTAIHTFERITTMRFLTNHFYSRFFKVEKDKCNSCGICVKNCPQNNISLKDEKTPQWGSNCIACFYCEMKCAEEAVKSPVDWILFAPLILYNLYYSKNSPEIEHVSVNFKRGKVKIDST